MSVQKVSHKTKWAGLTLATAMLLAGCSANSATEPTEPSANSTSPSANAAAETNSGSPAATATSATPTASPTPAEVTWAKHKFANENFQIELPSNWKIETIKPDQYQLVKDMTASFNIVSENGRDLAEVRTGYPEVFDLTVRPTTEENTLIDSTPDPAHKMMNYAFISYNGSPNEAWMMLTAIEPEITPIWEAPLDGPVYTGGTGLFQGKLDNKAVLPSVDPALKGTKRFKAYTKTAEYKDLKKTMLSFKQLKAAPAEQEATGGNCVGAQYTYDLGDSGMSCDEAKAFFSQILKQPISTGAAEIMGVGACMMPFDTDPGYCNIDASGGKFTVTKK